MPIEPKTPWQHECMRIWNCESIVDNLPLGYQYDRHVREYYFWTAMGIYLFSDEPRSVAECVALALAREYPPDHPAPGDLGSIPL